MKIRILQAGSENFTGDFGPVPFIDGVSTRDVTQLEAQRLGGLISIETVEDKPRNPSASQCVLDSQHTPMDAKMDGNSQDIIKAEVAKLTRADLEKIADKDGIEGLRPIGSALNVKSNSIAKLIDAILRAQAPAVKVEVVADEASKVVSIELPAAQWPFPERLAGEAPAEPKAEEPKE